MQQASLVWLMPFLFPSICLQQVERPSDMTAQAYVESGLRHVEKHEDDKAFADFNKAIELDPRSDLAYRYRGQLFAASRRDFSHAIADLTKALELNPLSVETIRYRGIAYHQAAKYSEAIRDYTM